MMVHLRPALVLLHVSWRTSDHVQLSAAERGGDQTCETVEIGARVLREPVDHPAQLGAGQVADSVSRRIMEAGVARLEGEPNIGPGDIKVDPLA